MDLKPGDVIDNKYEVEGPPLGRGGMGVVYSALHRQLGTHFALKFLHPSLFTKPDSAARFLHEARAGNRIKSHHVARVHDVGTHAGAPYIVMEHLAGSDLDAVLKDRGPLSVAESADLILQACEAVHEAHVLGIVHRDLKPSNLFVTKGPDGLKVLDFGIAKSPFADQAAKTATYAAFGTPFYMSPEQLASSRSADARSDLWSLGVILYQMLGDTVPFAGSSMMEIHEAIRQGRWTKLSEHCEGLPPAIDALMAQALELDREKRIPSVLAFATQLAPFGGEVAQESFARIRRVASHASGAPLATARDAEAAKTAPSPTASRAGMRVAALGILACLGIGAGLASRHQSLPLGATAPSASQSASSPPPAASSVTAQEPTATAQPSASAVVSSAPPPAPPAKPACTGSATPECEAACRAHARGACESLATALVHGRGAPRDSARAATLYTAACDEGSMSACNALGAQYGRGDGVPHDDAKAVALYSRACDGGNARGCVNLGAMYFDGTGCAKDERLGAQLFRRACEGGEALGCKNLGIAYRDGRGVAKNAELARDYAAKSVELKSVGVTSSH